MANEDAFCLARACFEEMLGWLEGNESAQLSHADLEDEIVRRGRETQRLAFQDHLDLRALRERRVRVVDAQGVVHGAVEGAHRRQLQTCWAQSESSASPTAMWEAPTCTPPTRR